jgi:hypothetical protein
MRRSWFLGVSSCSQMRRTRQSCLRSVRVTSRSRRLLASSLRFQNSALFTGVVERFGQQCQKQPSTKTASLSWEKTKSGLPKTGRFRRHPMMSQPRKNRIRISSVPWLPFPRNAVLHSRPEGVQECSNGWSGANATRNPSNADYFTEPPRRGGGSPAMADGSIKHIALVEFDLMGSKHPQKLGLEVLFLVMFSLAVDVPFDGFLLRLAD